MNSSKRAATPNRFLVMCVPDNDDSGFWFVYDRQTGKGIEVASHEQAVDRARLLNGQVAR